MKTLSIDYGDNRIGLAISDKNEKLASRFLTIKNSSFKSFIDELILIISKEDIKKIIIGIPVGFKNKSKQAKKTRLFINKLKQNISLPIIETNEVFTSKMAEENLRKAGIKSEDIKKIIDQEAARIILQDYLDNQ